MNALINWLNSPALYAFGAPTTWAEVLGFATGALCVYLVARQHILNWPIGIANNLLWILLFATAGLYADSGLQIIYIALALWGWWQWLHGGRGRTPLVVTSTNGREWLGLMVAGVSGTALLTWFLQTQTPSTVPFFDAVTTVISLLAVWGQAKKKWESWLLWMTADVIYVPLYHHKGLDLTALLYIGFFLLCVKGLHAWRRDLADRCATLPVATPTASDVSAIELGGAR
jgi:nicotinamide mononucleotide transporter